MPTLSADDLRALLFVLVVLLSGMAILWLLRRKQLLGPELLRKLVHTGMGGIAAGFPWLFQTTTAVWALAGMCVLVFLYMRTRWSFFGPILHDVKRVSFGEMAWVLGVALCFQWRDGTGDYLAAIAVLSLSDPAAALVGAKWGKHPFTTPLGNRKSYEGSAACFITTLLVLGIGVLGGCWAASWPMVAAISALVTALEAGTGFGLDNLVVPLAVLLLI